MPECKNCGEHVTKQYVRVATPKTDPDAQPDCCPWCHDKVRRRGQPTDSTYTASGRTPSDGTAYTPNTP